MYKLHLFCKHEASSAFAVGSAIAVTAATCFRAYCRHVLIMLLCSAHLVFLIASQAAYGNNACGFIELDSYVRGHHSYLDIWTPFLGEVLQLKREPDNIVDQNAVALSKWWLCHQSCAVQFGSYSRFLRRDFNKAMVEITGSRLVFGSSTIDSSTRDSSIIFALQLLIASHK